MAPSRHRAWVLTVLRVGSPRESLVGSMGSARECGVSGAESRSPHGARDPQPGTRRGVGMTWRALQSLPAAGPRRRPRHSSTLSMMISPVSRCWRHVRRDQSSSLYS